MSDLLPIIQARVRSCTKCWLHKAAKAPVPYRGPMPARIVVIGEAPGDEENDQGLPFIGKAGRLLEMMLREAGINPATTGFCNVVSCWPGRRGKGYRTPTADERDACRGNLLAQLGGAQPDVAVLAGGVALNAFRPDMKITNDRGRPFIIHELDLLAVPVFHPSFVLRVHENKAVLQRDLKQAKFRLDKANRMSKWPEDCRVCHREVEVYDEGGVAWCENHKPLGEVREAVPMVLDI